MVELSERACGGAERESLWWSSARELVVARRALAAKREGKQRSALKLDRMLSK